MLTLILMVVHVILILRSGFMSVIVGWTSLTLCSKCMCSLFCVRVSCPAEQLVCVLTARAPCPAPQATPQRAIATRAVASRDPTVLQLVDVCAFVSELCVQRVSLVDWYTGMNRVCTVDRAREKNEITFSHNRGSNWLL